MSPWQESSLYLIWRLSSTANVSWCDNRLIFFPDMLTEENEQFVEFGIGGLCNCSLGMLQMPLTNWVQGLYCKLQTMSVFSSSIIIYDPSAMQVGHELKWKKQGVITCRMDQELNESKMFIRSIRNWFKLESTPQS